MAKKTKSFSHIEAQDALEKLNESHPSGEELVYHLLSIFCGYGEGNIRRIREGVGNKAKDGRTILIPNLIAYRPKGLLDFHDEIRDMQSDARIVKQTPRLYVVSDGKTIVAADPKEQDIYENEVALMWKDFEFFYPLAGIEKIRNVEEAEADVKSAELMAKIFDEIRRHNDIKDKTEMHNLNIFMSRLLFCFFAEDTRLFPEPQLFTNSIRQHTAEDGHDLAEFIDRAFLAMSTDNPAVLDTLPKQFAIFPYVNGGLFEQRLPIPVLSRRARVLMIKCGDFDWKDINPDIFGSMIQAVVTPEMRAGLGMHYTSVPNIMKLICPLFLDELNEVFEVAKGTKDIRRLRKLLVRLGKIKFFDPACGSGNFLIVSYKCVRELEIKIWQVLREWGEPELPMSNISLQQFYGIEIDDFACDTATLSLWLAEHQMNIKFETIFKVRPNALPLRPSGHIVCGNACRLDWETVCPHTAEEEVYVMGNPPYVGSRRQNETQKADMKFLFKEDYGELDYISCWFFACSNYIRDTKGRYAFVSTNSICQGLQMSLLWKRILANHQVINFAYYSFKWSNNAKYNAVVTVIIVGVCNEKDVKKKMLYSDGHSKLVDNISPLLIDSPTVFVEGTSKPICKGIPLMNFGNMPADGGKLILSETEREELAGLYPNIEHFIRPLIGAEDFINGKNRWCIWLYGCSANDYLGIKEIRQRIEELKIIREQSSRPQLAAIPHLFAQITQPLDKSFILIPRHSSENREYIPMGFFNKGNIAHDSCLVVGTDDLWLFGILTSKMHMAWVKTVGGRLETRYRYSAQLCYNTFPFPAINEAQKAELEKLAQEVLDVRNQHFDMTPGEQYNPETMPEALKEVHHRLDLAVERCYRPEPFSSDEERLECLFKLYAKMTKK